MTNKIHIGIIHGRFQPPHNGHIRYIETALSYADHLIIGICTPKICTKEESEKTGYPCTAERNPFSYEARMEMISESLKDLGIDKNLYSFIPFPSDYKNIEKILPKDAVFLMSITGNDDAKKIAYIENMGFTVKTILSLSEGDIREKSGIVREGVNKNDRDWENLVPKAVEKYIKEHKI